MEQHTGTRIKAWRKRRGLTQAALAGFAGVSQSYVSQLESGLKDIERRSTLVSFARALQVAAHDLVNEAEPTDPLRSAANAAIPQLRAVLLEMTLGEHQHTGHSKEATRAEWQTICDLRRTGGYTSITPRPPNLLTDLAAHNDDALPDALGAASACIRFLGHRDLARDAAEVGISRAQERDDHTWAAHLKRVWIRGMPIETAALSARQAMRVADELHYLVNKNALNPHLPP